MTDIRDFWNVSAKEKQIIKEHLGTPHWRYCPRCRGNGYILIENAAGDRKRKFTCPECHGSKVVKVNPLDF